MASSKPITTIGSKEFIDFPELNLQKVPAKVDTGADSSAIWASSVNETKDGHLSFVVFKPGSKFFTGLEVKTKMFKHVSIKNSSGSTERRYKVKLLISINS